MARLLGCVALVVSVGLLLPGISAQDKKEDKKTVKGKGKDTPGDKKGDVKPKDPEEKLVYGQVFAGKLKRLEGNSNRDFTVEVQVVDQKKVYDLKVWQFQNLQNWQAEQLRHINAQRNLNDRRNATNSYLVELARRQADLIRRQKDIYTAKDQEVRAAEKMKIRSMFPPVKYDDRGFLVKYTKKDLAALRGNTTLPGYPAEFDDLKTGQLVQVYLAKLKAPAGKGKGIKLDDDDPVLARPEVVLIVIQQQPLAPR